MATDRDPGSRLGRLSRRAFGLRTLLVLVLLVGGGLGWIVRTARVQREAVATVRRLGGQCRYDWEAQNSRPTPLPLPGWRKWLIENLGPDYAGSVMQVQVVFPSPAIKPTVDDLASIGRLTRLEHLWLTDLDFARPALARIRNLSRLKHLVLFASGGVTEGDLAPLADLADLAELEELQLSLSSMSDADLATLARLTRLKRLSLSTQVSGGPGVHPSITDAGLVALGPLQDLQSLQISGENKITDAGLAHVARLTRLEMLSIQGEKLTSVEPLRPLVGLQYLTIGGTGFNNSGIDDAGAATFADFPRLKFLTLMGCKSFTNAGLAPLRTLPNLEYLDLSGSAVDDAGVASLVEFPALKHIFLGFTPMTDAGLAALVKRPGLATIDVGFTKVSPGGAAAARAALPGTNILHQVMPTAGFTGSIQSLAP